MKLPKCDICIHRHDHDDNDPEFTIYCDAFPGGKSWKEISDDEKEECANGIRYEDEDGEYKDAVPDPGSILSKMKHLL